MASKIPESTNSAVEEESSPAAVVKTIEAALLGGLLPAGLAGRIAEVQAQAQTGRSA